MKKEQSTGTKIVPFMVLVMRMKLLRCDEGKRGKREIPEEKLISHFLCSLLVLVFFLFCFLFVSVDFVAVIDSGLGNIKKVETTTSGKEKTSFICKLYFT